MRFTVKVDKTLSSALADRPPDRLQCRQISTHTHTLHNCTINRIKKALQWLWRSLTVGAICRHLVGTVSVIVLFTIVFRCVTDCNCNLQYCKVPLVREVSLKLHIDIDINRPHLCTPCIRCVLKIKACTVHTHSAAGRQMTRGRGGRMCCHR